VFDFEGDGKAEVVYRDELYLRMYRARTDSLLFQTPMSSCTCDAAPAPSRSRPVRRPGDGDRWMFAPGGTLTLPVVWISTTMVIAETRKTSRRHATVHGLVHEPACGDAFSAVPAWTPACSRRARMPPLAAFYGFPAAGGTTPSHLSLWALGVGRPDLHERAGLQRQYVQLAYGPESSDRTPDGPHRKRGELYPPRLPAVRHARGVPPPAQTAADADHRRCRRGC